MNKAWRILEQSGQRKATDGQSKLYAWYGPEVDCISKGRVRKPYEFGVKVGIASALKGNLILGTQAFHGNPYGGLTLNEQLEPTPTLMQDSALQPETAFVDKGYPSVEADNPNVHIV